MTYAMGWFDGRFANSRAASGSGHLDKLDAKSREFLERESHSKSEVAPITKTVARESPQTTASAPSKNTAQVPPESLFQDGRYAHIWKNYQSKTAVDAAYMTDHDRLLDVMEGFNYRKSQLGRAAMENCAFQQETWVGCMKSAGFEAKTTLCSEKMREFERCYNTQSRLLKALGYLSHHNCDPQKEDDIQMHADNLYARMKEQERAIEEAIQAGREPPKFPALFGTPPASALGTTATAHGSVSLSPKVEKRIKEQVARVKLEDREAEEAAIRGSYQADRNVFSYMVKYWDGRAQARAKRKAEGTETIMDKVTEYFGWK